MSNTPPADLPPAPDAVNVRLAAPFTPRTPNGIWVAMHPAGRTNDAPHALVIPGKPRTTYDTYLDAVTAGLLVTDGEFTIESRFGRTA